VSKPVPNQFEPFSLNSVNTHPPLLLVSQEARRLKDLEVPRCRLPGVLEDCRDFPGRHGAAVKVNRQQHSPPGSVR
jgi:hypothetical protein